MFTFNFNISFRTISSVIFILGRSTSVFLSRTGTSVFGSFVKTIANYFWRIFAFSLLSNFVEVLSFSSCKRGKPPVLVLSLLWTCDQNIFGLLSDWIAEFLLNCLFDLRKIALTLFQVLVYACRTFSASQTFQTFFDDIHHMCSLLFFRMASRTIWLIGTLPLVFHNGIPLSCIYLLKYVLSAKTFVERLFQWSQ